MKKTVYIATIILTLVVETVFAQSIIIDSLNHQGLQRKYTIHTPSSFSNATPIPVVLMLHGAGGTMQNSQTFTNLNSVSNLNGFLAVYPQGIAPVLNGFSWADGRGTTADQNGIDDIGFIDKLLDVLVNNYSADTNRIYICGFSNGGFMTQRLACEANTRFAAMASLGSTIDSVLISNCNPNKPIPMFLLSGTADTFVPYNGDVGVVSGTGSVITTVSMDTLVRFWRINNTCNTIDPPINLPDINTNDNSTVTVFDYTDCACNATVKLYRVNEGGHTWPGVSNPIYELIAGPTNLDIEASVELWDFFNQFTRCDLLTGIDDLEKLKSIHVFPNPTSTKIFIEENANHQIQYQITNFAGQTFKSGTYHKEIDLTELSNGIYILTIKQNNKTINRKIIKQ